MNENDFYHRIHQVMGDCILEELKDGDIDMDDEKVSSFLFSCFPDESCIDFVLKLLSMNFDYDEHSFRVFIEDLYEKGKKHMGN